MTGPDEINACGLMHFIQLTNPNGDAVVLRTSAFDSIEPVALV